MYHAASGSASNENELASRRRPPREATMSSRESSRSEATITPSGVSHPGSQAAIGARGWVSSTL